MDEKCIHICWLVKSRGIASQFVITDLDHIDGQGNLMKCLFCHIEALLESDWAVCKKSGCPSWKNLPKQPLHDR